MQETITHNQYQILFGTRKKDEAVRVTFNSKLERDEYLEKCNYVLAAALIDIEVIFDSSYNVLSNNLSMLNFNKKN